MTTKIDQSVISRYTQMTDDELMALGSVPSDHLEMIREQYLWVFSYSVPSLNGYPMGPESYRNRLQRVHAILNQGWTPEELD